MVSLHRLVGSAVGLTIWGVWALAGHLPALILLLLYLYERDRRIREGNEWANELKRALGKAQALRELPYVPDDPTQERKVLN